jgi:hypothetical protein
MWRKRLLISRFQVRVLDGSLYKYLQMAGNGKAPASAEVAFDTLLILTGQTLKGLAKRISNFG